MTTVSSDQRARHPETRRDLSKLARGGALSLVGSIAYGVLSFVLVIIVTRGLGKDASGAFFEAVAVFIIASNAAELGADTGLVRMISRYLAIGRSHDTRWTMIVAMVPVLIAGTVLAILGLTLADVISGLFAKGQHPETVAPSIRALSLFLPLSALATVAIAGTRGFGTMVPTVVVDKIGKPVGWCVLAGAVIVAGFGSNMMAVAYGVPLGLAFIAAMSWLLVLERRAEHDMHPMAREITPPRRLFGEFWRFTAPRGLAGVFQVAILWLDTILLGILVGPGAAAVYTASSRYIVVGQALLTAVVQAIAPQISTLLASKEHERAEAVYQTAATWLVVLSWPIYLTMAVFAPVLVRVFGSGFGSGAIALSILSLAMLVSMACGPVDVVLLMGGRSWWSAGNTIIALILNVVLNLLLIPLYGVTGAAIAWSVSILVRNLLPLIQVSRFLNLTPFGPGSLTAVGLSLAVFGLGGLAARSIFGASLPVLLIFGVVSMGVYALAAWRLRRTLHLPELGRALARRRPVES